MATPATASPTKLTQSIAPESETPPPSTAVQESAPENDQIARLAYGYWLERQDTEGSPEEDWFRAEQEVRGNGTVS